MLAPRPMHCARFSIYAPKPIQIVRRLLLTLMMVSAALLPTVSAQASAPVDGSGTFAFLGPPTILEVRQADGNLFITQVVPIDNTGTLNGPSIFEATFIIHPDGTLTAQGIETFTGTVDGVPGTLVFQATATGNGTSLRGNFVIVSGTGGLANLRGQGTFEGIGASGTYSLQTHSDP